MKIPAKPLVVVAVLAVLFTAGMVRLAMYARSDRCAAMERDVSTISSSPISAYYATDYASARAKFVAASRHAGAYLEQIKHPTPGPDGGPLYTDVALVGNPQAEQFLVLIAGTHGVEGFAGSALQVGLLQEKLRNALSPETAVLLIHAINPYGMAYLRRFNEDNIDVNRNFRDHALPPPQNTAYENLASAIAPDSLSLLSEMAALARLQWFRLTAGKVKAKAAISGGQYSHPEGLFYGGTSATWSNRTLRRIVHRYLRDTREVVVIDIHTALGGFGEAVLLANPDPTTAEYQRATKIWEPSLFSETATGKSAHRPLGATVKSAAPGMLPATTVTAVTLEFGTFPSVDVLRALRAEHWLHHHGDPSHPQAEFIKTCILQTYYPRSENWKVAVWKSGEQVIEQALSFLQK